MNTKNAFMACVIHPTPMRIRHLLFEDQRDKTRQEKIKFLLQFWLPETSLSIIFFTSPKESWVPTILNFERLSITSFRIN